MAPMGAQLAAMFPGHVSFRCSECKFTPDNQAMPTDVTFRYPPPGTGPGRAFPASMFKQPRLCDYGHDVTIWLAAARLGTKMLARDDKRVIIV